MPRSLALLTSLLLLVLPSIASAQHAEAQRMIFQVVGEEAQVDLRDTAIDVATRPLSFVRRALIRTQLREQLRIPRYIDMRIADDEVTIRLDRFEAVTTPRTGRVVKSNREAGPVAYTTRVRGDVVIQKIESGELTRYVKLSPDARQRTLEMEVIIRHPELPRPVRYTVRYRSYSHLAYVADRDYVVERGRHENP